MSAGGDSVQMRSEQGHSGRIELDIQLPLDRFSLRLNTRCRQPVTGIFGASGAGKSSLLETLAGLRRGAQGTIRVDGELWLDSAAGLCLPPELRGIGYVPQEGLLFPHWTVRQNLLAGANRAAKNGQDSVERLHTLAPLLELEPLLGRQVTTLSGGERQRVALGRALCSGPRLLLLDEPMASLDLPMRRRLLPLLQRIRDELTVPMLLVSHDPIEVQALCDDLLVLRRGELIAQGAPGEVLTDPRVFPLADREGFETLLPGILVAHHAGTSRVRLGNTTSSDGPELLLLPRPMPIGSRVLVGIAASGVLLAVERPRGLSARNILPARIVALETLERQTLVTTEIGRGLPRITVQVAETTPERLQLEVASQIYLIIKAAACRLYGESV